MDRTQIVQQIHASPTRLVFACSGGGSLAASDLLTVAGATRTVLEVSLPYAQAATARYIGSVPDHYCRNDVARSLAMVAFHRGQKILRAGHRIGEHPDIDELFRESGDPRDLVGYLPLIGIGCSASLATDTPKRGTHRVHLAVQTLRRTILCSLQMVTGRRTRLEEERLVGDMILNLIARMGECQREDAAIFPINTTEGAPLLTQVRSESRDWIQEPLPLPIHDDEPLTVTHVVASPSLIDLFFGQTAAVRWHRGTLRDFLSTDNVVDCRFAPPANDGTARNSLFPGAFRPLHDGHLKMLRIAEQRLGTRVALELAIRNIDKPPIDYHDLHERLTLIGEKLPDHSVWLTQLTTFREKARAFGGTTFVVGADTLHRLALLKHADNTPQKLHEMLRAMASHDTRFLVFARRFRDGRLNSLETLDIPDMLRNLADEVPTKEFCHDISSSGIRRSE